MNMDLDADGEPFWSKYLLNYDYNHENQTHISNFLKAINCFPSTGLIAASRSLSGPSSCVRMHALASQYLRLTVRTAMATIPDRYPCFHLTQSSATTRKSGNMKTEILPYFARWLKISI